MRPVFWRNPIIRAFSALLLCLGIMVVLVRQNESLEDSERQLVVAIVSSSWKFSELIYEAERFGSSVTQYRLSGLGYDDVQTQFDLLWSRVSVVQSLDLSGQPRLVAAVADLEQTLADFDPYIYGDGIPDQPILEKLRAAIAQSTVALRRSWINEYNLKALRSSSPVGALIASKQKVTQWLQVGALAFFALYLIMEVYYARRAQAREQRLTKEAHAASQSKSDFIANVSHEIRTPLNGILGMARVLQEADLTRDQRECLDVLVDSGGVLLSTINDVLDMSKIESGEVQIELRRVDIEQLIWRVHALYVDLARQKNLSFDIRVADRPMPALRADERRLRQILNNLVANAIKFTGEGQVRIEAAYLSVEDLHDGTGATPELPDFLHSVDGPVRPGLHVAVVDTGTGISEEAQARIFEPFAQADAGITRSYGGTGLGLTISRDICRAMGGALTVESTLGQGAVFRLYLPLELAAEEVNETETTAAFDADAQSLAGMHVLIVDDSKVNRLVLKKLLAAEELEITEAESGPAAIEHMQVNDADVILMDVQMPFMDGVEAMQRIRADRAERGQTCPPILAVTANAMPEQVEEYRSAGMDAVISKPVNKIALLQLLRQHLPDGKEANTSAAIPDPRAPSRAAGA